MDNDMEQEELVSAVDDAPVYVPLDEKAPSWVSAVEGITGLARTSFGGLQAIHWSKHGDSVRAFMVEAERAFNMTRSAIPEFKPLTDNSPVRAVWKAYYDRCTSIGRLTPAHRLLLTIAGTTADQLKMECKVLDAEVAQACAAGGTEQQIRDKLTRKDVMT